MKLNYHIHTKHSDGELSVSEIITLLAKEGVTSFAITDHDCIDGNYEAREFAEKNGMKYFNGIELSCCVDNDMNLPFSAYCHILGLGFEIALMEKEIEAIIQRRNAVLNDFILRLQKDGYNISPKEVYLSPEKWKDRTAIARILMEKHDFESVSDVFAKVINTPQYAEYANISPSIQDAIKIIHRCKGIAIWGHPLEYTCGGKKEFSQEQVKKLLKKMIGYGLNGIEVFYQRFSKDEILFLETLAVENNLAMSIGTDFHRFIEETEDSPFKPQRLSFSNSEINPNAAICTLLELNEWYQKGCRRIK